LRVDHIGAGVWRIHPTGAANGVETADVEWSRIGADLWFRSIPNGVRERIGAAEKIAA